MSRPRSIGFEVNVLKDINSFTPAGCPRYVRGDARVLGTVKIANEEVYAPCKTYLIAQVGDIVDSKFPGATLTATKIMTDDFGELLIAETQQAFEDLAGACCI